MVLECLLWVLVLVNAGAGAAMGVNNVTAGSSSTTTVALISPVSPRHSVQRVNHSLVVAIVVLMVLAIAALFCCCYLWERQLRLRINAARTTTSTAPSHVDHRLPQMTSSSSPSVIVLVGEDVTRAVAWAVPRRTSSNSSEAVAATQATAAATIADHSFAKLAPG